MAEPYEVQVMVRNKRTRKINTKIVTVRANSEDDAKVRVRAKYMSRGNLYDIGFARKKEASLRRDRSSLIRLASSLPKGSPERRVILSHLTLRGGPPPNEKVTVNITADRGGNLAVIRTTMSKMQEYNNLLDDLYAAAGGDGYDPNLFEDHERAKQRISDAHEELNALEKKLRPLISRAKKLKVPYEKYIKQNMHHVHMMVTDSSGQEWFLDGGEDWTKV